MIEFRESNSNHPIFFKIIKSAAGGHLSKVTNPALDCSLVLHIGFISARFRVKYDLILYCKGCLIKIGYFFMMSFLKITPSYESKDDTMVCPHCGKDFENTKHQNLFINR